MKAKTLFGTPKTYSRLALEDPGTALEAVQAAEALAPAIRAIRTFG